MNEGQQPTSEVTRAGVVTVSIRLIQQLFGNECKVERVGITDEDFTRGTISVMVRDHPSLPIVEEGKMIERVSCVMQRNEDGSVTVQSFHRF